MLRSDYKTVVFDCDGVVLDSNTIKTNAFRQAALPYGKEAADALVAYHTAHGGVSRYHKFEYFLSDIIHPDHSGPNLQELLHRYAAAVSTGLRTCAVAKGLEQFRETSQGVTWLIVSGGDQEELRNVFAARNLDGLFDGGIFGSPDTKDQILSREIANKNIQFPAVFLGDSRYDHIAAKRAGLDFVFLSNWSEFSNWEQYIELHHIQTVPNILSYCSSLDP